MLYDTRQNCLLKCFQLFCSSSIHHVKLILSFYFVIIQEDSAGENLESDSSDDDTLRVKPLTTDTESKASPPSASSEVESQLFSPIALTDFTSLEISSRVTVYVKKTIHGAPYLCLEIKRQGKPSYKLCFGT